MTGGAGRERRGFPRPAEPGADAGHLPRAHRDTLVQILRTVDEDLSAALLDDDQAQTLENAFDEIEDVPDDVSCSTRTSGSVSGVLGVSDDG